MDSRITSLTIIIYGMEYSIVFGDISSILFLLSIMISDNYIFHKSYVKNIDNDHYPFDFIQIRKLRYWALMGSWHLL